MDEYGSGGQPVSSVGQRDDELAIRIRVNHEAKARAARDDDRRAGHWTAVRRTEGAFENAGGELCPESSRKKNRQQERWLAHHSKTAATGATR